MCVNRGSLCLDQHHFDYWLFNHVCVCKVFYFLCNIGFVNVFIFKSFIYFFELLKYLWKYNILLKDTIVKACNTYYLSKCHMIITIKEVDKEKGDKFFNTQGWSGFKFISMYSFLQESKAFEFKYSSIWTS